MLKNSFAIICIIILSFFSYRFLLQTGFFPMHDNTQVARVFEMTKSLKDGMIPVRWVSDLGYGYGYPIFTFYAPLAYYVGGLIGLVTSALLATKIMIGLGIVLSGVTMFFLGNKLFGRVGGIVVSLLYIYAPYHGVDVFVRGNIAEVWAYACLPLAFLGIVQVWKRPSWKAAIATAVGIAGVILSHNLSAFMLMPFLLVCAFVMILFSKNKRYALRFTLYAFIFGLGLSAFYTLPVIAEMKYTNVVSQIGGGADFHDHFVCLSQLWQSPWGYGGSAKGCVDGLSFMVGKIQLLMAALGVVASILLWRKHRFMSVVGVVTLAFLLFSLFMTLQASEWLWNTLPFFPFLQYPWRYLLLASFFSAVLGGVAYYVVSIWNKRIGFLLVVVLVLGLLVFASKYFVPQTMLPVDSSSYTSKVQLTFTTSRISDEYMPKDFDKPSSLKNVPSQLVSLQKGTYVVIKNTTQEKDIELSLPEEEKINLAIAYFPAWQARLDGKEEPVSQTSHGIQLTALKGMHRLALSYRQTPIEIAGDIISLTSAFLLILGIILEAKLKDYGTKSK